MKYLRLGRAERKTLMDGLERMADFMAERFASISAEEAARSGPDEAFAPVEQCWHLADLEREGFGARIRRLLEEEDPFLPDFDGRASRRRARLPRPLDRRGARRLPGGAGIQSRPAAVRGAGSVDARRHQEGVGRVALCDLPSMMAEHDAAHRAEIEAWDRGRG
jgi:hypothetical protein